MACITRPTTRSIIFAVRRSDLPVRDRAGGDRGPDRAASGAGGYPPRARERFRGLRRRLRRRTAQAARRHAREVGRTLKLLDDGEFQLAMDPGCRAPRRRAPASSVSGLCRSGQCRRTTAGERRCLRREVQAPRGRRRCTEQGRLNAVLAGLEQPDRPAGTARPRMVPAYDLRAGFAYGLRCEDVPGIREAIEERRWDEANQYIGVVARALNAYSARLDRAVSGP